MPCVPFERAPAWYHVNLYPENGSSRNTEQRSNREIKMLQNQMA